MVDERSGASDGIVTRSGNISIGRKPAPVPFFTTTNHTYADLGFNFGPRQLKVGN
jgi:hypothetical protein